MDIMEMKEMTHRRPSPWSSVDALALPRKAADDLEALLAAILVNEDDKLNSVTMQVVRQFVHNKLEFGSGAIKHDSDVLARAGRADFDRVFARFCEYLGQPAAINKAGDVVKEVKDWGRRDSAMVPVRGHMTNQALAFHSDRADISVLACWETASRGGEFKICSSAKLVEVLEQQNPVWLQWLSRPIPHDLRDEGSANDSYCMLPILRETEESFVLRYIRKFNDSVVRHQLPLQEEIKHMLDGIDSILDQPEISVQFTFEKGSLVLVNNHTTLHARTEFVDIAPQQRCLLRCWLSSEFTRALPEEFSPIFHNVQPGMLRGGIVPDPIAQA